MDYVKITELPMLNETVLPLTAGDVMPIVHGPTTYQVQLSNLQDYFNLNIQLSANGDNNQVVVNQNGQLSAFPGLVYIPELSGLQVGYDNLLTGQYSSILGGAQNTNNNINTHIIGSNIQASLDDYTLVNNLSAMGVVKGGNEASSIEWYQAFSYSNANSARLAGSTLDSKYAKLSGATFTGNVNVSGTLTPSNTQLQGLVENNISPTITSQTVQLDLGSSTTFTILLTSNVNFFSLNNVILQPGKTISFYLALIQGSAGYSTVNFDFGSTLLWPGGNVPVMTAIPYSIDVYTFIWTDKTGWLGFVCGQNFY